MPDFDLNIWNTNAEAELFAEYQTIAAYDPAEKARGVLRCGLSTTNISQFFVSGRSTTFGPRLLRSMSFTMANTIIYELPAVFVANDRVGAVQVMIGRVVASVAVTLGAECAEEIERVLHDHCERIAASSAASDGEKQAAGNIETSANGTPFTPAANAFALLWQYISTGLTPTLSSLQTEATHETGSYEYAPFDELVCACADIVARIVVSLCTGGDTTLPDDSVALIGVIKLIISIALYSITRWIMHQKDEKGGWAPWLGTILRGLIVADERQCHWTGPAFDIMEGQITPRLICPITVSLVVDPVVGPHGHIYERERLYLHLQIFGHDPVSKEPATALSYTHSPVAARLAKEIARHYGAYLEPL